jgi:hypothetical protein
MKRYIKLFVVLGLAVLCTDCEKDDICAPGTPTTPRLVIEFYNNENPAILRNVTDLKVKNPEQETFMSFNNTSKIEIPLRTFEDFTVYEFTINSNATGISNNTDRIQINYTRDDIYVSRACGFKTFFELNPIVGFDVEPGTDDILWIKAQNVVKTKIDNENEIHIKLFF